MNTKLNSKVPRLAALSKVNRKRRKSSKLCMARQQKDASAISFRQIWKMLKTQFYHILFNSRPLTKIDIRDPSNCHSCGAKQVPGTLAKRGRRPAVDRRKRKCAPLCMKTTQSEQKDLTMLHVVRQSARLLLLSRTVLEWAPLGIFPIR